jgi:hypothetical protein
MAVLEAETSRDSIVLPCLSPEWKIRQTEATDRMAVDGPLHRFIVALFTEMYRLPLTIYFLT